MQDHVPYFIYEGNKTMRIQVVLPTFMSVLVLQLYWMLTRVLKMIQLRNVNFCIFYYEIMLVGLCGNLLCISILKKCLHHYMRHIKSTVTEINDIVIFNNK